MKKERTLMTRSKRRKRYMLSSQRLFMQEDRTNHQEDGQQATTETLRSHQLPSNQCGGQSQKYLWFVSSSLLLAVREWQTANEECIRLEG